MWKGADKRFKKVPWAKIEGRKVGGKAGRGVWEKRVEREEERRGRKGKRLVKSLGYEFEAGELKMPEVGAKAIEGGEGEGVVEEEEEKTIVTTDGKDGTVVISEEVVVKKTKKAGKRKAKEDGGEASKAKKAKKAAAA